MLSSKIFPKVVPNSLDGFILEKLVIVEKRWKSRWLDPSEVNALQSFVGTVIDVLKPKAVFSVGCCAGFQKANTNLGDVVISAKLSTTGDKKIVCDEQQSDSRRLDVSTNIGNLIKSAADG